VTALALRAVATARRAPVPVWLRLGVLLPASAAAFWFSLQSLSGQWRYETPLADLILVPLLAAGVFAAATRRHPYVGLLRLGWFDLLLAATLLGLALALLVVGPVFWSKYFWTMRLDLLALPLFVAGGVLLLFGARAIVPFWFPLLSLFLAWPLPYLALLEHALAGFTEATVAVVAAVAPKLGLATPMPGAGAGTFLLEHGSRSFSLSIGSACSGVNALVGFFVLAVFALYFVEGRLSRRLGWLALGAMLVWVANIARILALFATGSAFGERAAVAVLHPIAGLVALNLAALVLLAQMPRFHLFWRELEPVHVDSPLAEPAPPEKRASTTRLVGRILLLGAAAAAFAAADGQLATAARGLTNDGLTAIPAFADRPIAANGWTIRRSETIGWAAPYYGSHSSWIRYVLRPKRPGRGAFTVWLDAVRSPDLGALDAYTLAHCYAFHGFSVDAARRIDLGDGVIGQSFVYTTSRTDWHAVSWQWPVRRGGGRVEHERLVLIAASSARPAPARTPSSGGAAGFVLSLLDLRSPDADPNRPLTRALQSVADGIVAKRIGAKA
jgi:exosortase/archaeosortase family protein